MTIEERLSRVEQQNKRLRVALLAIVLVAVAGVAMGQAGKNNVPDVIEAKAFHVVTDDGRVLVKLQDSFGLETGIMGTITTLNGSGRMLVALAANAGGEGTVTTRNSAGQILVELTTTVDGKGMVTTRNSAGQELVALGVARDGTGMIAVMDPSGKRAAGTLTPRPR